MIKCEKHLAIHISAALGKSFEESMPNKRCFLRFPTPFKVLLSQIILIHDFT